MNMRLPSPLLVTGLIVIGFSGCTSPHPNNQTVYLHDPHPTVTRHASTSAGSRPISVARSAHAPAGVAEQAQPQPPSKPVEKVKLEGEDVKLEGN